MLVRKISFYQLLLFLASFSESLPGVLLPKCRLDPDFFEALQKHGREKMAKTPAGTTPTPWRWHNVCKIVLTVKTYNKNDILDDGSN